jgi:hypothetical protein
MAYQIEVRGYPQVNLRVEVLLQDMDSMTIEEMMATGSVISSMPVVNAIAAVVAARPGSSPAPTCHRRYPASRRKRRRQRERVIRSGHGLGCLSAERGHIRPSRAGLSDGLEAVVPVSDDQPHV